MITYILTAIAICIAIASLVLTIKQTKVNKNIEIEKYIDEAWDLMGGKKGVVKIMQFSNENELFLAERCIKKALLHDQKHVKAIYVSGVLYEAKKDYKNAEETYLRCIKLSNAKNGDETSAFHNLGRLYLEQKRTNEALDIFRQALLSTKKNPNIILILLSSI
jgi:tetratricopeptide (TPR) repeat protein